MGLEDILKRKIRLIDAKGYGRDLRYRLKKFGITVREYNAIFVLQQGRCGICEEPLTKPCIDHCHTTGKVRGILCPTCNTGLGMFKDSPKNLSRASSYLSNL